MRPRPISGYGSTRYVADHLPVPAVPAEPSAQLSGAESR